MYIDVLYVAQKEKVGVETPKDLVGVHDMLTENSDEIFVLR